MQNYTATETISVSPFNLSVQEFGNNNNIFGTDIGVDNYSNANKSSSVHNRIICRTQHTHTLSRLMDLAFIFLLFFICFLAKRVSRQMNNIRQAHNLRPSDTANEIGYEIFS